MAISLAPIRENIDYFLFQWLKTEQLKHRDRFSEHERETYDAVLDLCQKLATDKFEPFNRLVDIEEPHFDGVHVTLPKATYEATRAYAESGMLAATQDYDNGGMQLPCTVEMAANSFFGAASVGMKGYLMLTVGNANLLMVHGTDAQKKAFAQPELAGRFFGTMNLSEPQAGSSLSDISTKAEPDGHDYDNDPLGARYRLTGRKMWISGGEHDLTENIIHLVLAKIPGPDGKLPAGVKGISLFVVPKNLVDVEGNLTGERNDIALAGLNHKLGYRGTTNTLLNYGEGKFPVRAPMGTDGKGAGAIGYLVGKPGEGLKCMFHMMNEARISVGLGATMLGFAGFIASLDYAKNRPQGRPMSEGSKPNKDPNQVQVPIIEHADVKRMLLAQKAYCEGALAFELYCASLVDEYRTGSPESSASASLFLELLTPMAKSWPSEWCLEANSLAIQVLGGYGYTRDFPVEQFWRDNRLNMIHEGTHGIHGLDLLGRKVIMQDGAALRLFAQKVGQTCARASEISNLESLATQLDESLINLIQSTQEAWSSNDAPETLSNATQYLRAFGHITLAWIWLELAITSAELIDIEPHRKDFHEGKLAAANYFFDFELPLASVWLTQVAQRNPLFRQLNINSL
jgi:alkylation response protein AidB-like acyl-CoA dehydrogenase